MDQYSTGGAERAGGIVAKYYKLDCSVFSRTQSSS